MQKAATLPETSTPGSVRAWILAMRLPTLTAAAAPVLVGAAVAAALHAFAPGPALAALAGALLIQIGTNFANDLFDYEKGADNAQRLGPARAVQQGWIKPAAMKRGMIVAFALAMIAGVYLVTAAGWPVIAIGLVSIASGIAYTGGPYPLGYNGLGDLFVFAFFGFVAVCGTVFVQMGAVPPLAIIASVPMGALSTAILVVNNLRDRDTDSAAGKRTLAVRFGRTFAIAEYTTLVAAAYATPAFLYVASGFPLPVLLPFVTLPLGIALVMRVVRGETGAALNVILKRTAILLFVFGVLFAAGLQGGSGP